MERFTGADVVLLECMVIFLHVELERQAVSGLSAPSLRHSCQTASSWLGTAPDSLPGVANSALILTEARWFSQVWIVRVVLQPWVTLQKSKWGLR